MDIDPAFSLKNGNVMKGFLILGNQLFEPTLLKNAFGSSFEVFMREDRELCTYERFHKHKISFFLAAMRTYADELRSENIEVHYETLGSSEASFERRLEEWIKSRKIDTLHLFEIEDRFFQDRIFAMLKRLGIAHSWSLPPSARKASIYLRCNS